MSNIEAEHVGEIDVVDESSTQVLYLPGDRFFLHTIEISEEVDVADLRDYLELELEGMSPFSLDQLYWGYYFDETARIALVYAMYAENVDPQARSLWTEYAFVLPSFVTLFASSPSDFNCVLNADTLTLLDRATLAISSWNQDFEGDDIFSKINEFLKKEGHDAVGSIFVHDGDEVIEGQTLSVSGYVVNESGHKEAQVEFSLTDSVVWSADVRESELTGNKQAQYRWGKWLWKGALSAVGLIVLFLGSEALLLGLNALLSGKEARVESRKAQVAQIEGQDSLVNKIEQVGTDFYPPFEMLERINAKRPKEVYFTSVSLSGDNSLAIEGVGQTVDIVNKYNDSLKSSSFIARTNLANIVSRQGQISFKLELTFNLKKRAL